MAMKAARALAPPRGLAIRPEQEWPGMSDAAAASTPTPASPEEVVPLMDKGKGMAVEGAANSEAEQLDEEARQEELQHWRALDHPRRARSLLRGAMTDADWEVLIQRNLIDVTVESYRDFMRLLHDISLMDDGICRVVHAAKTSAKRVQELEAA